jgi:hypothetical protein
VKQYWHAPELWPGSLFVIIAGGPSLTDEQVAKATALRWNGSKARVIAINDGYRKAPAADVLYFCDDKWWTWHHKALASWGGLIVRLEGGKHDFGDKRIKVMRNYGREGFCDIRDGLMTGRNSGFQALNLAAHLGAKRIVLLGYDMRAELGGRVPKTHWFGDHPGGTSPDVYNQMRPLFATIAAPLADRGIEVFNCSPGSALTAFPRVCIDEAAEKLCALPA